jgi:plasmid stabilization system protein ParE
MKSYFLPDAEEEFLESSRYYESEAPGVGVAFIVEVHRAVSAIVALPRSAPKVRGSIRKKILNHFPHNIFYSIEKDLIVIVAVAHHRRRPLYWNSRMRKPLLLP